MKMVRFRGVGRRKNEKKKENRLYILSKYRDGYG
jgi:hypothetical protein